MSANIDVQLTWSEFKFLIFTSKLQNEHLWWAASDLFESTWIISSWEIPIKAKLPTQVTNPDYLYTNLINNKNTYW